MPEVVLDASVVLAFINNEPGADAAGDLFLQGLVSAMNVAEVVAKLIDQGLTPDDAALLVEEFGYRIAPVDAAMGIEIGRLRQQTRGRNISLGDRCCLALAMREGLPVVTANRAWAELGLDLDIRLLR